MSENDLQQHQVFSEHVVDGLKCNTCNSLFQNKISLEKTHCTDSVHERKKSFKCKICDARFPQNSDIKRHVASVHEGKKYFQCNVCDASFAQNLDLKKYVAMVHERKSFSNATFYK